ncbi:hypothetical protein NX02_01280 [Sphingomonas sanxanigenens DSM 19645 = NX02]|uniref:Beta-glucuronidase C-terminal domain-containing protein n=2 Tax=Sphingomonas sanxanigenens TaxID=397260 RepID=W0A6D2_9SPHN|nr:hypothetical protein NX02_01280 [Sphingomonas sanxanigenens DSM 19645 = NX02]
MMDSSRRQMLQGLATVCSAVALPARGWAQDSGIALTLDAARRGATIPADFVGLSYERAQLANPAYFSAENSALVALFKGLSPVGNLRIGGSSGEHTAYVGEQAPARPPFEIFGPEHNKTVKEGLVCSTPALRSLRTFLDATGWSCIYGLNLAHATREQAAAEAADVHRILGPRLLAFQIGNEPDVFRNRYRPAEWGPEDFMREWAAFHDAIAAAAPGAKFGGPDISNKLDYLTVFAREAHRFPDVIMLTGHYYAMGPAGSPDATMAQLMEPEPKTTTLKNAGVETVQAAVKQSGLPFRMAEGNSCWDGGKPGISDTHASAIWGADAMLKFAERGWIGINWHGGGYGHYSAIVGTPSAGFSRRPLYDGTRFGQMLVGATFLALDARPASPSLGCYALSQAGKTKIVLVNKHSAPFTVTLPAMPEAAVVVLTGPSLAARDGTTLKTVTMRRARQVTVPAATAMLFTLAGR